MSEHGCMCWNCSSFGSAALLAASILQCAQNLHALNPPKYFIIAEQTGSVLLANVGGSFYYPKAE